MHLGSADICELLGDCLKTNQPPAIYATDAVMALDQAQVQRGLVISSAYLYGWNELGLNAEVIAARTRQENEFTAAQVKQFPQRLTGFLSVDPLQPSAIDEIRHWQGSAELRGLKLHLSASAVDLKNPAHRAQLLAVVQQAAAQSLPMLIHIGGGDFADEDAQIFIREILPATSPSWVQIAHAGGGMPLQHDNHLEVLRSFADLIARDDPRSRKVLFDLSYVPAPEEGTDTVTALVQEMRRIGMGRLLFGSDFNVLTPLQQIAMLQRLDLTAAEMQLLRDNCAPWVCASSRLAE